MMVRKKLHVFSETHALSILRMCGRQTSMNLPPVLPDRWPLVYTHLLQDIKSNTNLGADVKDYADKIRVQNQLIGKVSNEPDLLT